MTESERRQSPLELNVQRELVVERGLSRQGYSEPPLVVVQSLVALHFTRAKIPLEKLANTTS
ncbi:hypothetical protein DVH05_000401 [Phytophthora capsici]|nr:hypothetical protein DVH05_000401 [Phytophthora capsici]